MKKGIAVILILVLLSISVAAQLYTKVTYNFPRRFGTHRITHFDPRVNQGRSEQYVYLEPVLPEKGQGVGRGGYVPIYPRGTAGVKSVDYYGHPRSNVVIKVKDLQSSDDVGVAYEVWAVDDDTGYRLTLGTFRTLGGGIGELTYNAKLSLFAFDRIEITAEPLYDIDLTPGPVVLVGHMQGNNEFNPLPAQNRLFEGPYRTY